MNKQKELFFFIGTEAELIKVFPVIIACMQKNCICHIIASGQNDLQKSRIMDSIKLNGTFLELSREEDIQKSAKGLLKWFLTTHKQAVGKIQAQFGSAALKGAPLIVHGDTVSTLMGAHIGKKMGCTVCHVEAGLRSHHLLNPFPEEIDRLLTSRYARLHFAPGKEPAENLRHAKGKVINTVYNTILDSLAFSRRIPIKEEVIRSLANEDYFVFVMHRQENLMNKEFVRQVILRVRRFSKEKKCVLILHKITETTLQEMGILQKLQQDPRFVLLPRVDYFDFMKLLEGAQYIITDGGSNQEELHYMGKPCLIMRKTTERREGIGENALLYGGRLGTMEEFVNAYETYQRASLIENHSPSEVIAEVLVNMERSGTKGAE